MGTTEVEEFKETLLSEVTWSSWKTSVNSLYYPSNGGAICESRTNPCGFGWTAQQFPVCFDSDTVTLSEGGLLCGASLQGKVNTKPFIILIAPSTLSSKHPPPLLQIKSWRSGESTSTYTRSLSHLARWCYPVTWESAPLTQSLPFWRGISWKIHHQ